MHEFYNRAIVRLLCVIALSLLVVYFFFDKAFIHTPLLPLEKSPFKLAVKPALDHHLGGRSSVSVTETRSAFQFTFKVMPGIDHPYAAGELWFVDRDGKPALADLSKYTTLSFFVQCAPANTLTLTIPTFDPRVSKPGDVLSYRTVWAYVPCNARGSIANVDITRLETPQWWYEMFNVDLLRHDYKLDQVPKIAFGSSDKSLRAIDSQVELADMEPGCLPRRIPRPWPKSPTRSGMPTFRTSTNCSSRNTAARPRHPGTCPNLTCLRRPGITPACRTAPTPCAAACPPAAHWPACGS